MCDSIIYLAAFRLMFVCLLYLCAVPFFWAYCANSKSENYWVFYTIGKPYASKPKLAV